jgi:hypothetical protein
MYNIYNWTPSLGRYKGLDKQKNYQNNIYFEVIVCIWNLVHNDHLSLNIKTKLFSLNCSQSFMFTCLQKKNDNKHIDYLT